MPEIIETGDLAGRRTHLLSMLSKKPTQGLLPGDMEDCATIIEAWQQALVRQCAISESAAELADVITLLRECERICEATLFELDEAEALHLGAHRLTGLHTPSPRLFAAEAAREARMRVAISQQLIGTSLNACTRSLRSLNVEARTPSHSSHKLELTRLSASELLGQALQDACVRCDRSGVYFAAFLDSDLHLRCDLDLVHPAVVGVLHDAIMGSAQGGTVRAYARLEGDRVAIEVVCDGGGRARSRREIARARTAVASHDGTLTVSDGPGAQHIYRMELPALFD